MDVHKIIRPSVEIDLCEWLKIILSNNGYLATLRVGIASAMLSPVLLSLAAFLSSVKDSTILDSIINVESTTAILKQIYERLEFYAISRFHIGIIY